MHNQNAWASCIYKNVCVCKKCMCESCVYKNVCESCVYKNVCASHVDKMCVSVPVMCIKMSMSVCQLCV